MGPDPGTVARYRLELMDVARRYKRYPRIAQDNNWEGRVELRIAIGEDGAISSLTVKKGAGRAVLDEEAQAMIRTAKARAAIPPGLRGKAFTIDDTVFMRQAVWALEDPLHPSALTMVWSEVPRPMRLSQVMPTGPLMAWLLTPAALAGGSEVVAHLVQLLLLALAILEVAALVLHRAQHVVERAAQYRLVTEGLKVDHLRLVMGTSMGGRVARDV